MNENLELITKKELDSTNKIIDVLVLNKEKVLLLYSDKLEIYKKSLTKSVEILTKTIKSEKKSFIHIKEIKSTNTYNIIAISTASGIFYLYKITDNSHKLIKTLLGHELISLKNNEFIIFTKKNSNIYTYSLYLIKKINTSFVINLLTEKNLSFKSFNEKYKKMSITKESNDEIMNDLKEQFMNVLPDANSFIIKNVEFSTDINILKIFYLSNDEIIFLIKENNIQKWYYITDVSNLQDKLCQYSPGWNYYGKNGSKNLYNLEYKKNHFIYSIIKFNYKTEKLNYLYNENIIYDFGELDNYNSRYIKEKETIIWSYDISLIENKFISFNIYYYNKKYDLNIKNIFENKFIICNINKNSSVIYNLNFEEFLNNFNFYVEIPPKYFFAHKNKNMFYMLFNKTLYEMKLKKDDDVEFRTIKIFNDDSSGIEFQILKNNIFYIITNKTLYKIKLRNNN